MHHVRARLVRAKPALINEIRGLLLEHGESISQGVSKLEAFLANLFDPEKRELLSLLEFLLEELAGEYKLHRERIKKHEERLYCFGKERESIK